MSFRRERDSRHIETEDSLLVLLVRKEESVNEYQGWSGEDGSWRGLRDRIVRIQ